MTKHPARLILLPMLLLGSSCRSDHGVIPTLDDEATRRSYSVSLVPVDPSLYQIVITVTDEGTTFFLNESIDTVIMEDGDSAIGYSGLVEVQDGQEFVTTDAAATFFTSTSSPTLTVKFDDPLATGEVKESVPYTFTSLTNAQRMKGAATWYDITSPVWGALVKGRLGKVNAGGS